MLYDDCIPEKVIQAAMAIPKSSFTLCPDPSKVFRGSEDYQTETGLAPTPPAIFARQGSPTGYWYARTLFVPDANHEAHYLLLAVESDDFTGQGLFFNFRLALFVALGIIGLSCLWWAPFVWHLARPLLGMADYAERIAAEGNPGGVPPLPVNAERVEMDNFVCLDKALSDTRTFSGERRDEIGRLGHAFMTMTRRVGLLISGQSQFIRHIAHELNSPLARTQIGLAILEERLEGNPKARVQRIMQDINRLSMLTDEVLSYLQAKASLGTPKNERIYLCPFLSSIVRSEAPEADVNVFADKDAWLWTDKDYLRRAVCNVLRNAIIYAGSKGPIRVRTGFRPVDNAVLLRVVDSGDGVPEAELPSLTGRAKTPARRRSAASGCPAPS